MYYSDKPIERISEDKLDRKGFAKTIAKILFDLKQTDTFTLGLLGKWGVGKTSLVNLILSEFYDLDEKNNSNTIILKFEPWHFTDTTQLISQFLIQLAYKFNGKKKEKISEIGEALTKYSVAFELAEYLPFPYANAVGKFGKFAMSFIGDKLQRAQIDKKDILRQKECVVNLLKKKKQRMLVIIDDIDRLSNEQIREVFQLVSSVAKFPYVTYLLVFDKDIVTKALEKVQEGDGNDYLEKIIQVPIEVPPIKQGKLFELLFQELTKLTDLFPDIPVVQEHWNAIFNYCVAPFVNTIRDVNRLLNLLQYKFCGISSDIDFSDMVAISVIELFLPKVYKWIKQNKNTLVGLDTGMNLLGKKESTDECKGRYSKEIAALLNNTNQYNIKVVMQCLTMLFPPFAKRTGYIFTQIDRRESRKHNYIYNEVKFDRYFSVDIDDVGIKSALVEKAIYSNSVPELNQFFLAANSNESIYELLEEIKARLSDLNSDRASIIASSLLESLSSICSQDRKALFGFSSQENAIHLAYDLFDIIDKDVRFKTLNDIIACMPVNNIDGIAHFLNMIELAYGRLAANGQERSEIKKIITLDELKKLEKAFIERCATTLQNESLFSSPSWKMAYYLINSYDKNFSNELMKKELLDDVNVVKFILYFVGQWEGDEISYEIRTPIDYLSNEQVLSSISNLRQDKRLFSLDKEYQYGAGAFFIAIKNNGRISEHIPQKEIVQLLSEWRN